MSDAVRRELEQLAWKGADPAEIVTGVDSADVARALVDRIVAAAPPWHSSASCAEPDVDPAWFFPARGQSPARAYAVCARCPVADECFDDALTDPEALGIRAGTSERARRRLGRSARRSSHLIVRRSNGGES